MDPFAWSPVKVVHATLEGFLKGLGGRPITAGDAQRANTQAVRPRTLGSLNSIALASFQNAALPICFASHYPVLKNGSRDGGTGGEGKEFHPDYSNESPTCGLRPAHEMRKASFLAIRRSLRNLQMPDLQRFPFGHDEHE